MKIIAAIDFSDVTDRVIEQAKRQARLLGAELVLLHAAYPDTDFYPHEPGGVYITTQRTTDMKQLKALRDRVAKDGFKTEALQVPGPAVDAIAAEIERLKPELVVMGSHGHGAVYHLLVGSVAEGVLRKTEVPVLIVPASRRSA